MRIRPRRLGLRARITLAFALGSLLLSVLLSGSTWAFTRQNQLDQRETLAVSRLYGNANIVRNRLLNAGSGVDLNDLLSSLATPSGASLLLVTPEQGAVPSSLRFSVQDLPLSMRTTVEDGSPATMSYRKDNEPVLAVGVPIPAIGAEYYEIVSLTDLEDSLNVLAVYLVAASAVTAVAGAALGWWASRRTLLPLADVGLAARAIAGGRLDTRLDGSEDPDLEALVSSFNEMATALQDRIERDARFASDVSHELRSPLMTLAASIEVLQTRRDEMPERSQAALDLLVDDVTRFQKLVADLLEISRFDSGAAHLDVDTVDAAEFIRQAVRISVDANVPVIVDPDEETLFVDIDKRRLARVIANLIDNASKYAGGATAVTVRRTGDVVEVAVEDEGPGVPDEDRARIFDRFSRGGATAGTRGSDSGVGLGLSLVAEHVRLHGGTARVESRLDGRSGARFVVELPLVELPELLDEAVTA
ncbi:MAG TPA: HAMP domain-containing sensor histidine kinase [Acidimicrobiales bacterium]|nr:HAMP domain-containing sensor histidine kinase [Acidimicrobiales bacterium]